MKRVLFLTLLSLTTFFAAAAKAELFSTVALKPINAEPVVTTAFVPFVNERLQLDVQTMSVHPADSMLGTILYLPGFADSLELEVDFFKTLAGRGYRVIGFDYPGHGKTSGSGLNSARFSDLSEIAKVVVDFHVPASEPVFLLGWSTGGLLAVRIAQERFNPQSGFFGFSGCNIEGLMLIAPGVAVYPLVGEFGVVTAKTLSRSNDFAGPISPKSPLLFPFFSSALLANSLKAQSQSLPIGLPVLTFVAGDDRDQYANSRQIKHWLNSGKNSSANRLSYQCDSGYHALHHEPEGIAQQLSAGVSSFIEDVRRQPSGEQWTHVAGPCGRIPAVQD